MVEHAAVVDLLEQRVEHGVGDAERGLAPSAGSGTATQAMAPPWPPGRRPGRPPRRGSGGATPSWRPR